MIQDNKKFNFCGFYSWDKIFLTAFHLEYFIGHYLEENTLLGTRVGRLNNRITHEFMGQKLAHWALIMAQVSQIKLQIFWICFQNSMPRPTNNMKRHFLLSLLHRLCFRTILTGDSSTMANEICRQPSQTG